MQAIVYTSNTGHTAEYAKILGEKTSLPVYALSEAKKQLSSGTEIIYLGWLFANGIKGYKKAAKKYKISAPELPLMEFVKRTLFPKKFRFSLCRAVWIRPSSVESISL